MAAQRDIVIVLLGGFAQGTFGAGVLSAMQDKRFSKRIAAVYGASSGALNAAGFISGSIDDAQRLYSEQVSYGQFVRPWRFVWSDALDIDRIFDQKIAPIVDAKRIRESPIECKVLLARTDTLQPSYVSLRTQMRVKLKAAIAVPPYYRGAVRVGQHKFIDGAVIDIIGASQVAEECPGCHIIVVSNEPLARGGWQRLKDTFESGVFLLMRPRLSWVVLRKLSRYNRQLAMLRQRGNVQFVAPSKRNALSMLSLDAARSRNLFAEGRQKGQQLIKRAATVRINLPARRTLARRRPQVALARVPR